MSTNNMKKIKKFKKELLEGYESTKKFIEKEGPKVHRYFARTATSAQQAFEVKPSGNKVKLAGFSKNNIALAGVSKNNIALSRKPRLKKVRGNLYWDLR